MKEDPAPREYRFISDRGMSAVNLNNTRTYKQNTSWRDGKQTTNFSLRFVYKKKKNEKKRKKHVKNEKKIQIPDLKISTETPKCTYIILLLLLLNLKFFRVELYCLFGYVVL